MANDEDKSDKSAPTLPWSGVPDRNGTYRAACDAAGIECKQQSKIVTSARTSRSPLIAWSSY